MGEFGDGSPGPALDASLRALVYLHSGHRKPRSKGNGAFDAVSQAHQHPIGMRLNVLSRLSRKQISGLNPERTGDQSDLFVNDSSVASLDLTDDVLRAVPSQTGQPSG